MGMVRNLKFKNLIDAVRQAYDYCNKEMKENGEIFYEVYLAYDLDYSRRFYVFHEHDEKIVNWIEERYLDYVMESNKIGYELERLKIWQYLHEEEALKYPILYKGARKAFRVNGEWIYRYPRTCTPEAQINFNLDN